MIRKYRVKNFGPFKLEEELNFVAKKISENKKHLLLNNEILPVISFYGPNGGGKTSFMNSLFVFSDIVIGKNYNGVFNFFDSIKDFVNIDSNDPYIEFYIEFEDEDNIYEYELVISIEGFKQEKYSIRKDKKNKSIVIYDLENDIWNDLYIPPKIDISSKNPEATLLNFFNSILKSNEIKKMFHFFKEENLYFLRQDDFSTIDFSSLNNLKTRTNWGIIEAEKNKIIKIFQDVNINIIDIIFEKHPLKKELISRLFFEKQMPFEKTKKIDAFLESSGTLKFLSLISFLLTGLKNGATFFIDELDSGLHTHLLKYIILLFKNKEINKNNAQLIFSSHDIGTLNKEVFRRDEIYFAAINESYFSNIISLSELMIENGKKVRNDHNYAKQYISGNLGYDPYIDYSMKGFKSEE